MIFFNRKKKRKHLFNSLFASLSTDIKISATRGDLEITSHNNSWNKRIVEKTVG